MQLPMSGQVCIDMQCAACCFDTEMILTNADVRRLEEAGHEGGWFEAEDGYLQLKNKQNSERNRCWYLDDNGRCSVYSIRPEGCQLYPLVFDDVVTLDAQHCPHTDKFPEPKGDEMNRLVATLEFERSARVS